MIILGGKGPKIVREMEKRSQDLRRKLLNKGGVRLIDNIKSGGLLTRCVPCWRDKEPYFWSSVRFSFSEAHRHHVKNSTCTWNFTHRFYSFQCAAAVSLSKNYSYYLHRATGWAAGTSEWLSQGICIQNTCRVVRGDERGVTWQERAKT